MVAVPAVRAETVPEASIEATEALSLDQLPPVPLVVKVTVPPMQAEDNPLIVPANGVGFTVIGVEVVVLPQAVLVVQLIFTVPAVTPVTKPPVTLAIDAALELQVPPATDAVRV